MFLFCVSIGFRYHKLDDLEIIGMDYIWKIVLNSNPNIANKAVELLKDCFEKTKKFARRLQDSRNCKVCLVEEVSRVLIHSGSMNLVWFFTGTKICHGKKLQGGGGVVLM